MKNYPTLTNDEIEWLISLPKELGSWTQREDRGHHYDEAGLGEVPPNPTRRGRFSIRARRSLRHPDDFSVALVYADFGNDDPINLLRLNGLHTHPHGPEIPPQTPHIHRTTSEGISLAQKSRKDPEHQAHPTTEYSTLEGAIHVLSRMANITQQGLLFVAPPK